MARYSSANEGKPDAQKHLERSALQAATARAGRTTTCLSTLAIYPKCHGPEMVKKPLSLRLLKSRNTDCPRAEWPASDAPDITREQEDPPILDILPPPPPPTPPTPPPVAAVYVRGNSSTR